MAYNGRGGYYLNIHPQAHKRLQPPDVKKEDTPKAIILTTNTSGYNIDDVQVQLEDDEDLVLHFGPTASRKFKLPSDAYVDGIQASWENGTLTIAIPKKP
ncbi:hypothetical protein KP509_1Z060700 [Ceratopteris richardii]|nr:hypothetical protein KP509_1Z060700 [Ceratopteris richardii]